MCLTLIMAHANECAALKSGGACLPDSVFRGVVCQCVRLAVYECVTGIMFVCVCVHERVCVCARVSSQTICSQISSHILTYAHFRCLRLFGYI